MPSASCPWSMFLPHDSMMMSRPHGAAPRAASSAPHSHACHARVKVQRSRSRRMSATPGRATATDDHVCVIGAGPAGLAVAAALHQVGIPVVVLERGTGPPSSGTALGLWTNAWRALDALHAAEELRAQYREVSLVQLCREGGRLLKDFDLHSCDGGPHEFRGVRRSSLVAALAARLPPETIRYGHAVSAVAGEDQGAGVALTVEGEGSGGQMRFAGVVGADGSASVAARAAGRKPARSVGQTAVRGVATFPSARDMPCDSIRQVWSVGPRAGMYPLTGECRKGRNGGEGGGGRARRERVTGCRRPQDVWERNDSFPQGGFSDPAARAFCCRLHRGSPPCHAGREQQDSLHSPTFSSSPALPPIKTRSCTGLCATTPLPQRHLPGLLPGRRRCGW
ncbi:hypothetical protein ACKKBF_B11990 [Auxenochlorella protothecoides x Auxenochlorella symbiontica]